jgi:hypothetical protein
MGSVRDRSGGVFVVGGRGDPHTQVLGQHRADRLDSPPQTTGLPVVRVRTDELRDQWEGRSVKVGLRRGTESNDPARFPRPLPEPGVHLSMHRALHKPR